MSCERHDCLAPNSSRSQNMLPFQTAYPMIAFLIYCILAGNAAFVSVVSASSSGRCLPALSLFCKFPLLVPISLVDLWMAPKAFAFRCGSSSIQTTFSANVFSAGHILSSCGKHPRLTGLPVFYLTTRVVALSTCSRHTKPGYCSPS